MSRLWIGLLSVVSVGVASAGVMGQDIPPAEKTPTENNKIPNNDLPLKEAPPESPAGKESSETAKQDGDSPASKKQNNEDGGSKQDQGGEKSGPQQDDAGESGAAQSEGSDTDATEVPVETPPTPIDWSVEGTMDLNFDHLKFNIKPDQEFQIKQLTSDLIKLRGRKIRLRGFIRPSYRQEKITQFVFVRDNQECCFGPGAALYDCTIVNLAKGNETSFSTRAITVEGTFDLKPFRGPDNKVWAIFRLNDAVVK